MRRTGVLLLAAVMMLGTLAIGGGTVAAQDATPVASGDHPLAGTWLIDLVVASTEDDELYGVFSADGAFVGVDVDTNPYVGAWEPTGDSTANFTLRILESEGATILRMSIEVAPDGQSFSGSFTIEGLEPDGTSSGEIGPGASEGTKIPVEPPGTPVMSLEEAGLAPVESPEEDEVVLDATPTPAE